MWKHLTIWLFLVCTLGAITQGVPYYSNYTYGAGLYGTNTPPTVLDSAPSGSTVSADPPSNQTFGITYIDYDGDTVTLEWYVDNSINQTDGNISIYFQSSTTANITANLSDGMERTQREWAVTIAISVGNISDILIIPSVNTIGNLLVVTANVTALTKNQTDVNATLNTGSLYGLFISETPKSQSIGNIYTTNYTVVQWVLYPSMAGTFPLNVGYVSSVVTTTGETENAVIVEQEDTVAIGLLLGMFFVLAVALSFIGFGFYTRGAIFVSVGGSFIGLLGGYIWINGISTITSDVTNLVGMIMSIIGGLIFMLPFFEPMVDLLNDITGRTQQW